MATNSDPKKKVPAPGAEDASAATPRGSRKMLLAAAAMCLVSLSGGFFLARTAYLQDAEVYEPEYKDEHADASHGEEDGHAAKDEGSKLRKDIVDPLAKDGHDAEKAESLKADDEHGDSSETAATLDSGLLDFGDILTNIEGMTPQGVPTKAFLKVNLVVAYRTDQGAGQLMEERQPFMRDLFNSYLRGLSEADVRGMAGVMYIKAELLKRARAAVGSDLPQEILIKDLIVQ